MMKKIIIEKEKIEYVIDNFPVKRDGAKYLGVDIAVVNNMVKLYGLSYPGQPGGKGKERKRSYPEVDKQWLMDNWLNTSKSLRQLSEEFNIPESILELRRNYYRLNKKFCYPLNTEKLFNINDPHVWYLAGLIATDGYLPKNMDTVEIGLLGESEKELLHEIHEYFEMTSPIYHYHDDKKDHLIRITANGLNEFLWNNFSIPSGAKTFIVGTPKNIPTEDCAKAYFRGCLDGDGSIKGKSFSILTASSDLISGIVYILNYYINDFTYNIRYQRNYPIVEASGSRGLAALSWTYSLNNCFMLKRKYYKFLEVNDIV